MAQEGSNDSGLDTVLDFFYPCCMQRNSKGQFVRGINSHTFEGFGVWYDHKGYPCIHVAGHDIKVHVFVWERINGPKPPHTQLHHINGDRGDWNLANLQLIDQSTHLRLHAGWVQRNGVWFKPCSRCQQLLPLSAFYPRGHLTPSSNCRKCHNLIVKERQASPEAQAKLKAYKHAWYMRRKGGAICPQENSHT